MTIKKGIIALVTDFVDNILMHDKIDVNKNIMFKRLFILKNIENGINVKL
jgi:hypothetical protein